MFISLPSRNLSRLGRIAANEWQINSETSRVCISYIFRAQHTTLVYVKDFAVNFSYKAGKRCYDEISLRRPNELRDRLISRVPTVDSTCRNF